MTTKPVTAMQFDIVIAGGSLSAPAAALAAARTQPSKKILLTEATDWLGGQATSQGVSAIDNCWFEPGSALMRDNPTTYYAKDYLQLLDGLWHKPAEAVGEGMAPYLAGWVSREDFDPRTAAWLLHTMIGECRNITYMPMTVVKSVESIDTPDAFGNNGKTIKSVTFISRTPHNGYTPHSDLLSKEIGDWYSTEDSARFTKQTIQVTSASNAPMVVIDATESGEVMVLSGADYTVGREINDDNSWATDSLPEMDEDGSQATVYPFCITFDKTRADSDKLYEELKSLYPQFDRDYADRKSNYFSFVKSNWKVVWTYRRIYCTGPIGMEDVNADDVSMQNWEPGNDYPDISIYKNKTQAQDETADWQGGWHYPAIAGAEQLAFAWYKFMDETNPMPWPTRMPRNDHPQNMMGTEHGLSKFPYIRCGRRVVGLNNFRLSSKYLVDLEKQPHHCTSYRFFDSVGIGDYAVDIHPLTSSRGVLPPFERAAPFYIPFRALASSNVRNLLAGGKNMATTYITNAAYRLHPIEWAAGSAVGTAAAIMADKQCNAYELLTNRNNFVALQKEISLNSPIHWDAYDSAELSMGDLVINDNTPVKAGTLFTVEIYCPNARYFELYADEEKIAEGCTEMLNDSNNFTAQLQNLAVKNKADKFIAKCYGEDKKCIGEIVATNRYRTGKTE